MLRSATEFWRDERAAIAPLYALSLFGLITAAGVGLDYGRMMAMDSELQNAADQAALAAATQLDGGDDAMTRAEAAARDALATASSEWVNVTVMSNDGDGIGITDLSFAFYESYDSATDTFGAVATDGADANVVMVTVNGREAFFALTAVVDAFSSGDIEANAVAGVETATCNVPPLMFCVPSGDSAFPGTDDIGKGISMHVRANQNDSWAPGNFGFLDIEYSNIDPNHQNHQTGLNSDFLGCAGDVIESRTGSRTPEMRALNTRFDIYENGGQVDCGTNGDFCPSQNTTKNWVVAQPFTIENSPSGPSCDPSPNNPSWVYAASTSGADDPATEAGFPQDTSTANGFGDGTWASSTFMTTNYPGSALSDVTDVDGNGSISRYEVYLWQLENATERLAQGTKVGYDSELKNGRYSGTAYCAYPQSISETPVVPSTTQKDRRIITVAAVDCTGLNGHAPVNILRWVDIFLVQPANTGGADQSFYAEVIGEAEPPGADQASFQYYGKNKPVLLR